MPGGLGPLGGGLSNWQALVAFLLLIAWFVTEFAVRARARSIAGAPSGERRDRGSGALLILMVFIAIIGSVISFQARLWLLPDPVFYLGVAVMITGIVIRAWAITRLGRHFSPVVRTSADQQIVKTGPYRLVRHPSYTGMVLAIIGYSVALTSGIGILVAFVAVAIGFGYRIHVEEAALTERFGEEYRDYVRSTWRLIPYLI